MEVGSFLVLFSTLIVSTCGFLTSDWDYFTFSQAWPPGTCVAGIFEKHTCYVPPEVQTWTIHGLWDIKTRKGLTSSSEPGLYIVCPGSYRPSRFDSKGPFNCDPQKPFDFNKLAKLRDGLKQFWPNLYNDTDPDSFWSHEWSKHGTCCLDLPLTSSEEGYFAQGLKLNQIYNITEMLRKGGVVPSTSTQYNFTDFTDAIKQAIGYEPVIQCAYTKLSNGSGYHLIDQLDICLDKQFRPISCYTKSSGLRRSASQVGNQEDKTDTDGTLRYRSSEHVYEPQSNCPTHYSFNYPPIWHS